MSMRRFDATRPKAFTSVTMAEVKPTDTGLLWLDVVGPTSAEVEAIGKMFRFHALAIEDARKRQQRPKVDVYPGHLFLVLYALEPLDDDGEPPAPRELAMFVTAHAIITIHRADIEEIDIAAHRWAEHCTGGLQEDAAMLAYTIADSIVDGYFPCMDAIGDRIEDLESAMFSGGGDSALEEIFRLKRLLIELRRTVAPTRDVFNVFIRRELPILGDVSLMYFQDVYDHVIRVTDSIDAYRDILSSVIDVHLTLVSNRLNQTVRTLTVASIILMSATLIAGIYGMNFQHMPELGWRLGYPLALAMMAGITVALGAVFKRLDWW